MLGGRSYIYIYSLTLIFLAPWLFRAMIVKGDSMAPLLNTGDFVLIYRWAYGPYLPGTVESRIWLRPPRTGHVVALSTDGVITVKRIAAAPGEEVRIAHGRIHAGSATWVLTDDQERRLSGMDRIPPGYVFVAGDRGYASYDSRQFGLVPANSIVGRIIGLHRPRAERI